ncbi:TPA: hypothetical protein DEO28_00625 [Candidatus Dependentiae bacterium]|nr:MAG: SurA domain protein [candidate division TM6 bacterium GW2011_GWE2_31_21]KKP54096.1 MAG: SurA domain protein [candidate division TM6 bacterium GW2011_GWF2_33_332]HBS48322.1 hypothetical protein [Candidatus Dependentiae bacterium]HBZ73004.1 hypothetical protein [Candidatus Dependentiae bacterium]
MKKLFLLGGLFLINNFCYSRELVNKETVKVNGVSILLLDLEIPHIGFEAKKYTIDDAIAQELYFQEALKKKLNATGTDLEKQISSMKNSQNIKTDEELESFLKKEGYTLKRYKLELIKFMSVNNLLQLEVKSRIFVTTQELEEYYQKNPQWEEAEFILKTCIIPFKEVKDEKDILKKKDLAWIQTDWVKKEDLSEEMSFISDMQKGDISKPIKTAKGYQLVQIVDKREKHLKLLDEVAVEVRKKIREEKMEKFEKEYLKELKDKAFIEYLD